MVAAATFLSEAVELTILLPDSFHQRLLIEYVLFTYAGSLTANDAAYGSEDRSEAAV